MRKSFSLIVALLVFALDAINYSYADSPQSVSPPTLYAPVVATFKAAYKSDPIDDSAQSWDDYWSWIQQFYSGSLLDVGWTAHAQDILNRVPATSSNHDLIIKKLNTLGLVISKEWAKDNSVRKIDTDDLTTWSGQITDAAGADTGDGSVIVHCLNQIQQQINLKLHPALSH